MADIKLKIEDLILDHDNPRITHAEGQQEALQKVVKEQKSKLVKLAQSIATHGLSPMDRLLVIRTNQKPERFIALEGNRRTAVLKVLNKPSVMTGLDMPPAVRRGLEKEAQRFSRAQVEPISGFELSSRQEGDYWLELKHMLVSRGVAEGKLAAILRSIDVKTSPTNVELFHMYVHERFATPSPSELKAAWNNAQPLFEKIWP